MNRRACTREASWERFNEIGYASYRPDRCKPFVDVVVVVVGGVGGVVVGGVVGAAGCI